MIAHRRSSWMMLLGPAAVTLVAVAMLLASAASGRRSGRRRFALPVDGAREPTLHRLRSAILGNGKRAVASLLGPPRSAQPGPAGTWYYPLSKQERLAIAISFDGGKAKQVDFVESPV